MNNNKEKILVTAYSYSGATRDMAKLIAKNVGGDFKAIIPEKAYPESYTKALKKSKIEISIEKEPKLKDPIDVSQYDTIFVGSPNWFNTVAPPVRTFLSKNDFKGKKVIPFATYGGGGESNCLDTVAKLVKDGEVLKGFSVNNNNVSQASIKECLSRNNYTK